MDIDYYNFRNSSNNGKEFDDYFKVCQEAVGAIFDLRYDGGVWAHALPRNWLELPQCGFKIHISSVGLSCEELLAKVLPILVRRETQFKFLVNERCLNIINYYYCPQAAFGKFLTIYPQSEDIFIELIDELYRATKQFSGPAILSDRRYLDSNVVFYRFGTFRGLIRVGELGLSQQYLQIGEKLVLDPRGPIFKLPEGVNDPFRHESGEVNTESQLINGRYSILKLLTSTAKGQVFTCNDLNLQETVVVKQARPHVGAHRENSSDAQKLLANECRILEVLQKLEFVPKLIDRFSVGSYDFLVISFMHGRPIGELASDFRFSFLSPNKLGNGASLNREVGDSLKTLFLLIKESVTKLRRIHELDVVVGDIGPQNILISDSNCISFIDFEASSLKCDAPSYWENPVLVTKGFSDNSHEEDPFVRDRMALANVLLFLILPIQDSRISRKKQDQLVAELLSSFGLSSQVLFELLELTVRDPVRAIESLDEYSSKIRIKQIEAKKAEIDLEKLRELTLQTVVKDLRTIVNPIKMPLDYRAFLTNPYGISFGIFGMLGAVWRDWNDNDRECIRDRYVERLLRYQGSKLNSSFGVGWAGIASVVATLDLPDVASKILLEKCIDFDEQTASCIWYGRAGLGAAHLYLYELTSIGSHLHYAVQAGESLVSSLESEQKLVSGDRREYHGLFYGYAGISLFLGRLGEASGEKIFTDWSCELISKVLKAGRGDYRGRWNRSVEDKIEWPYLDLGAIGIGYVAASLAEINRDLYISKSALDVAWSLVGQRSIVPGWASGIAGIAEYMSIVGKKYGEPKFCQEAQKMIAWLELFSEYIDGNLYWPCAYLKKCCHDSYSGAAGVYSALSTVTGKGSGNYVFRILGVLPEM